MYYITQLPVKHRSEERVTGINKRPTIVVTQMGTTIAGINWVIINCLSEFINSCPLSVMSGLPSCTPSSGCVNAIIIPSLLPFLGTLQFALGCYLVGSLVEHQILKLCDQYLAADQQQDAGDADLVTQMLYDYPLAAN